MLELVTDDGRHIFVKTSEISFIYISDCTIAFNRTGFVKRDEFSINKLLVEMKRK